MEYVLGASLKLNLWRRKEFVLILIVMEYVLGVYSVSNFLGDYLAVLILIVMEYVLGAPREIKGAHFY